jgi:hypothetical protein
MEIKGTLSAVLIPPLASPLSFDNQKIFIRQQFNSS